MEDTHSGVPGLTVTVDVEEEFRNAFAHAPIPRLKTEEKIAMDWDELQN